VYDVPATAQTVGALFRIPSVYPDQTVEEARRDFEQLGASPLPAYIHAEPAAAGGIKAEWLTTSEIDRGRVILYLHGVSYVMGGIGTHRELAGRIAQSARGRVLIIDYRLAPEHCSRPRWKIRSRRIARCWRTTSIHCAS